MSSHTVPASLIAGDTWTFTLTDSDHPAPAWDATIYLENSAGSFSATAADYGEVHAFSVAAATTAARAAGRYKWFIRVTDGTIVLTAQEGWIDIQPNPASGSQRDHRSPARKMLDAIEAFLIGNASTAQKGMSINGRSIERHTLPELTAWRDQLRNEVRGQESGAQQGRGRNIKVRFVRP